MILDSLDHASLYTSLGSNLAAGFAWLRAFNPATADGRYPIDGDNVYALVQSYETAAPSTKKFESHRTYLDIQYIAAGTEIIQYAPIENLVEDTPYDAAKDYRLYTEQNEATSLLLSTGSFAIFYPNDGHKPGCVNGTAGRIKKVVIKARV